MSGRGAAATNASRRYWQAMLDRRLRRQRLVLFFSRKIETSPSIIATAARQHSQYDALLQEMTTEFEQLQQMLANIFTARASRR